MARTPKTTESIMPTQITLTCLFGIHGDDGNLRLWQAGQVVDDPEEIKLLVEAGAEHYDLE